jgi:hypothetical protein
MYRATWRKGKTPRSDLGGQEVESQMKPIFLNKFLCFIKTPVTYHQRPLKLS